MFTTASTSLKTALRPIAVSCLALSALSACVTTKQADSALSAKQDTAIGRSAVLREVEAVVNMFIVLAWR